MPSKDRVEPAPARDAMDVLRHLDAWQLAQLLPGQRQRRVDLAGHREVPAREIVPGTSRPSRRGARATSRSGTGPGGSRAGSYPAAQHLLLGLAPEHAPTLDRVSAQALQAAIRPRAYVGGHGQGRSVVPPAHGLERRRGARPGRGVPGTAADREGAADRAADRAPARRRRLPHPHRAVARRAGRGRADPVPVRREVRDRGRGARLDDRPRRPASGRLDPDPGLRRPGLRADRRRRRAGRRRSPTRSSSGSGSSPARRPGGASSTTACCRPRRGSRSTRSASRRAATRARSPSPASTTAAIPNRGLRVLELEGGELPGLRRRARRSTARRSAGSRARSRTASGVLALAYVRREVPEDAVLSHGSRAGDTATLTLPAPVAQGIERCPAEAEVARSNRAGRISCSEWRTAFAVPPQASQPARRRRERVGCASDCCALSA